MKLILSRRGALTLGLLWLAVATVPCRAAALGTATAEFDNTKPGREETAWGRLVADAMRAAGRSDLALINAGALKRGVLKAGPVEPAAIESLLTFGDDEVVVIRITGAQLRTALERAAQAYPDGSPAFLHSSGLVAAFNGQAPVNHRVTSVRVRGHEVGNNENLTVAMPVSLAQGSAGYFVVWSADGARKSGSTTQQAVANFIHAQGQVTPDPTPRFAPQ